ncbi:protein VAPYRIN-like [Impatiens glandulifera]|uniref:protein VAPYRIN-like n=1 Tax=Impatiens glandulifera TaxID=253017 RepID=UPI001FB085C2|nr:protein VAPYRIN-like [Impatiens glandulifera]
MEKLVEVSEQEVRIDFTLGTKCRATVRLTSLTSTAPIAFKVQTSSPHKFLVNPPCGLIPPSSSSSFQIILKPQSQIPSTFPRSPSDRFLVKTALAPDLARTNSSSDFINSWFNNNNNISSHNDIKLKIAFVGPFLLRHAVAAGDYDAVRNIIKRQKKTLLAEFGNKDSESLLRVANELDNSDEMVNLLIESGLRTKANHPRQEEEAAVGGSKGWTALHVAAAFDRTEEIANLVSGWNRDELDCRDKDGRTALHLAASKGNESCVRLLVSAGADVNARSKDGRTALYRAAANGNRRMVEMLIEMGADPTICTIEHHHSRSAIDAAREKGHKEVMEILERGEAVLDAARRGDLLHLEALLERDATTNFRDQYGLTALHVASIKGFKDAVMTLVDFGAEIDCRDGEGHTPLHLAAEGGHLETAQVLINRGADIDARTQKGATPLYMATTVGQNELVQLLISRGASSSTFPSSSLSSSAALSLSF